LKHIESRSNPLYKQLFKWQSSAGRRAEPVILDGIHLCESWLGAGRLPKYAIFDVDRIVEPQLIALIERLSPELCLTMSGSLLGSLSGFNTSQGVLFVVQPKIDTLPLRIRESVVILDRIQDPGNVGTLLRTSAAAGIKRVFATTGTATFWSPRVLRSGQGAHFALRLHEQADLEAVIATLEVPLVVTSLDQANDLFATALPKHCAWVFGNEGQGVEASLLSRANLRVRIEHDLSGAESLNVTAAAAICLFEQRRQHYQPK
jgi:TrmH family RNA methyltransferase